MLTLGEFSSDKLYFSSIAPKDYKYCVHRTKLEDTISLIEDGTENCLVHASLGNGKTLFIDALSSMLTQKGYIKRIELDNFAIRQQYKENIIKYIFEEQRKIRKRTLD